MLMKWMHHSDGFIGTAAVGSAIKSISTAVLFYRQILGRTLC